MGGFGGGKAQRVVNRQEAGLTGGVLEVGCVSVMRKVGSKRGKHRKCGEGSNPQGIKQEKKNATEVLNPIKGKGKESSIFVGD